MTSTIHTLVFEPIPTTDQPAPTMADIRTELAAHPGQWAVVYRADRLERAQTFADRVNSGAVFGPGFVAEARSLGSRADARTYAMALL
jgi:hypothetical protein